MMKFDKSLKPLRLAAMAGVVAVALHPHAVGAGTATTTFMGYERLRSQSSPR